MNYQTKDATARAGADYLPASGQTTFGPQETTKQVELKVIGNTLPQKQRAFLFNLSDAEEPEVTLALATVTINDDDTLAVGIPEIKPPPLPELNLSAPQPAPAPRPPPPAGGPPSQAPPAAGPASPFAGNLSQAPPAPPGGASAPVLLAAQAPGGAPGFAHVAVR